MELIFFEANQAFRKVETEPGVFVPAPFQKNLTSIHEPIPNAYTPTQLADLLNKHAARGHWLLKGQQLTHELSNESRAGKVIVDAPTNILVVDFDDIEKEGGIEEIVRAMGLSNYAYTYQYSSSQRFDLELSRRERHPMPERGAPIRAHLIFLLEHEVHPGTLKDYLISKNLSLMCFKLNADKDTLSYSIDVNLANNANCLLIAPPKLLNPEDEFLYTWRAVGSKPNGLLVKSRVEIAAIRVQGVPANKVHIEVNRLRQIFGLGDRPRMTYTQLAAPLDDGLEGAEGTKQVVDIIRAPTKHTLEIAEEARGFIYFKIVGTSKRLFYMSTVYKTGILYSWQSPDYRAHLRDVCAPMWEEISQRWDIERYTEKVPENETKEVFHVFRNRDKDKLTSVLIKYKTGRNVDVLLTEVAKKHLDDHIRTMGYPNLIGTPIPDAQFTYNPTLASGVSAKQSNQRIEFVLNTWSPADIPPRDEVPDSACQSTPPMIKDILWHMLGEDAVSFAKFEQWLAFIVQTGRRTETAWLIYGVQGTGKGLMVSILSYLLGDKNVAYVNKAQGKGDEKYSSAYEDKQIYVVNEARRTDERKGENMSYSDVLKSLITDTKRTKRRMHADPSTTDNFINVILTGNVGDGGLRLPVEITPDDRRYNIPPFQMTPFRLKYGDKYRGIDDFEPILKQEAVGYYYYLRDVVVARAEDVRIPMSNRVKQEIALQAATRSQNVGRALMCGDWSIILESIKDLDNAFGAGRYSDHQSPILDFRANNPTKVIRAFVEAVTVMLDNILFYTPDPGLITCPCCHTTHYTDKTTHELKKGIIEQLRGAIHYPGADKEYYLFGKSDKLPDDKAHVELTVDPEGNGEECIAECTECAAKFGVPSRMVSVGITYGLNDDPAQHEDNVSAGQTLQHGWIHKPMALTTGSLAPILRYLACDTDTQMEKWLDSGSTQSILTACQRAGLDLVNNKDGHVDVFDAPSAVAQLKSPRALTGDWIRGKPRATNVKYLVSPVTASYEDLLNAYRTLRTLEVEDKDRGVTIGGTRVGRIISSA